MANMSYCRFENTHNDLTDCLDVLREKGIKAIEEDANQYEKPYIKELVRLCKEIVDEFGDEVDEDDDEDDEE